MLVRKFEPTRPYRFARYGRMSDRLQNKRSPDQQFATIDETINRCGYPWIGVTSYRDDGISGRYIRKRPGLQALLRDIETGVLQVDLIVVDTLERLGRADEIGEIRRKLFVEYGVLVVAADNNFADPTGVVGKAVGLVENIRSTEDGRIKAHNVIRGKKDAARLRRWPGGPPPFGFRLKPVINNTVTPPEIYNVLEQDPAQAAALRLAFERAVATGEGDLRLSQWWNESSEIPDAFKPINPFTMSYRLKNPIAIGTLRWGHKRTGIVNDTRVVEPNPDGAEMIPDFCQPVVSVELYEGVQRLQQARGQQIRASRRAKAGDEPAKLIAPQAQGLTLKYLLSGLIRCGCCNASMRPVPSGRRSKGGRRYTYYTCPRHYERACRNGRHVSEESLRDAVLTRVRGRLFPLPELAVEHPAWLPELLSLVRLEQERYRDSEPNRHAADSEEEQRLEKLLSGWMLTLGNPSLPAEVRADIELRYVETRRRQTELQHASATRQACREHVDTSLGMAALVQELHRLSEVLAGYNPTLGNLELSKHIGVITCDPDGRIELRGTNVGIFRGAVELISRADTSPVVSLPPEVRNHGTVTPRRRGRLKVPSLSVAGAEESDAVETAPNLQHNGAPPAPFQWAETFVLPRTLSWAEANAAEVARLRGTGMTMAELARHFGRTVPTIRASLKHARAQTPSLTNLPVKLPRRRWEEDHADEVRRLHAAGWTVVQIAQALGKSAPTIRKALWYLGKLNVPRTETEKVTEGG